MSPFSSVASPPGPLMTSTAALPSRPSSSSSAANSGVCLMGGLTTRNLTAIFLKHRQEHRRKRFRFGQSLLASSHEEEPDRAHATGSQRLLSADREDGDVSIEMSDQLPPLWVDMVEEANDDITHIKEKMSKLQKCQQKKVLKVFDNGSLSEVDREMESLCIAIAQVRFENFNFLGVIAISI
eukprot:GHVT01029715.1.p1 GENE.GHVT01029715.1~~GHVT01029715.1.p1  ORF type:complete len:182 (+),score=36.86 GHVT01029715.1:624-1169(+)